MTVGFLSTAAFIAGLPLVPFWGAWADRYSRKAIIVRSAAVETVLFLLLSAGRTRCGSSSCSCRWPVWCWATPA